MICDNFQQWYDNLNSGLWTVVSKKTKKCLCVHKIIIYNTSSFDFTNRTPIKYGCGQESFSHYCQNRINVNYCTTQQWGSIVVFFIIIIQSAISQRKIGATKFFNKKEWNWNGWTSDFDWVYQRQATKW